MLQGVEVEGIKLRESARRREREDKGEKYVDTIEERRQKKEEREMERKKGDGHH